MEIFSDFFSMKYTIQSHGHTIIPPDESPVSTHKNILAIIWRITSIALGDDDPFLKSRRQQGCQACAVSYLL